MELIRALIPPADTDVASLLRDEGLFEETAAGLSRVLDPQVRAVAMWESGPTRTYEGIDGFRKLWLDWLEPWASYHVHVDEFIDRGDRVVLLIRDQATREDSDAVVELRAGSIWTVSDGRITNVEFCSREDALEAAGRAE